MAGLAHLGAGLAAKRVANAIEYGSVAVGALLYLDARRRMIEDVEPAVDDPEARSGGSRDR